jgi:hypothetical protein
MVASVAFVLTLFRAPLSKHSDCRATKVLPQRGPAPGPITALTMDEQAQS